VHVPERRLPPLRHKLVRVTGSTLEAVLGFAALSVSKVRPIRELGIWTAVGLSISWVVAFTLLPALQIVLRTPTGTAGAADGGLYRAVPAKIPGLAVRPRRPLVGAALLLCIGGAAALFGIPGWLRPMSVGVDTLTYMDPSLPLRQDLVWFRDHVGDLNVAHVWIHLPRAAATDPEVLQAVDRFQSR